MTSGIWTVTATASGASSAAGSPRLRRRASGAQYTPTDTAPGTTRPRGVPSRRRGPISGVRVPTLASGLRHLGRTALSGRAQSGSLGVQRDRRRFASSFVTCIGGHVRASAGRAGRPCPRPCRASRVLGAASASLLRGRDDGAEGVDRLWRSLASCKWFDPRAGRM